MIRIHLLLCYPDKPTIEFLCERFSVGSVNLVVDDGDKPGQIVPHENSPIFAAFKDLDSPDVYEDEDDLSDD